MRSMAGVSPNGVYQSTPFRDFTKWCRPGHDHLVNIEELKWVRVANLRAFVERKYDGNKSAAARDYGCQPQQMNDLLAGRKSFGEKVVKRCVERMGIPAGYLDTPNAEEAFTPGKSAKIIPFDRSKFVEIPRFEVQGSMGPGIPLPDMETIVSGIRVSAAWVRTELHNVSSPSNLAIITGYGDSMEGTFRDGAQLIVDRGVKDVKVDAIYVLSLNDELYIKRLQRRPDGSILMISDNTKYPPYVIENGERSKFAVLGRVVGAWNFSKI